MQYVFFKKGVCDVHWGLAKAPQAGEFSRIFVFKVTLQSVSYRKMGSRMYYLLPQ